MADKPTTIDEYLAAWSDDKRAALDELRQAIRAAAPEAEECIAYDIPGFRIGGKYLVGFGAAKNHCAFYPGTVLESYKDELEPYGTSKGTIPLPTRQATTGRPGAQAGRRPHREDQPLT